eukprot:jgi/Picsp_1/1332/NSC_04812-R1_transcription factor bhlh34
MPVSKNNKTKGKNGTANSTEQKANSADVEHENGGMGNKNASGRNSVVSAEFDRQTVEQELNLLDGDTLFMDLDDKTLQCLVGGLPLPNTSERDGSFSDGAGPSDMLRQQGGMDGGQDFWIPKGIHHEHCGSEAGGRSDKEKNDAKDKMLDERNEGADASVVGGPDEENGKTKAGKRARPGNEAAAIKASREKKRRERMNQYFDELSNVCGVEGSGYKGDRLSIIVDAIRVVRQLRVEVNQLRQLNKFLEERTSTLERERAQHMFQYGASNGTANGIPMNNSHQLMHQGKMMQNSMHATNMHHQASSGFKDDYLNIDLFGNGVRGSDNNNILLHREGLPPTEQEHGVDQRSWLPASNLSEDQKLRPPAA